MIGLLQSNTQQKEYVSTQNRFFGNKLIFYNIDKRNGDVVLEFERDASGGEFTTCDMPSMGFEEAKIDMIKLVGFE